MYQVLRLYGDFEPWWLLDGWQEDIIAYETFDDYDQAEVYYQRQCQLLSQQFPNVQAKSETMSAFWDPKEQRWCDECDEFLQQYHSLLILELSDVLSLPLETTNRIRVCHVQKKAE